MGNTGCSDACDATRDPLDVFIEVNGTEPLKQGDILFAPYIYPLNIDFATGNPLKIDFATGRIKAWIHRMNVVVLSHSCALEGGKVDLVLLSPIWEITDYVKDCFKRLKIDSKYYARFFKNGKFDKDTFKSSRITNLIGGAISGSEYGYTVLKGAPVSEKFPAGTEPLLADFNNTYSLPIDFIEYFIKTDEKNARRLRLVGDTKMDLLSRFNYFLLRAALPREELSYKNHVKPIVDALNIDKMLDDIIKTHDKVQS
jgi:hypothetical protein